MKTSASALKIAGYGWHYVLLLLVMSALTGCAGLGPKPPNEAVVKARQKIVQNRESATLLVPRIKATLRGKETGREYIRAQKLYDMAMVQNNSWATSLKLGIENNEGLEKSRAFKDKAGAASAATERFVKFGKKLTEGKASASLHSVPAFMAVDFVKAGIVIWKELKAEEKKDRLDQAARIEKELRWAKWEEVK